MCIRDSYNQFPLPCRHFALNTNVSFYELHLVQGRWEEQIKQYFAGGNEVSHKEKSFKSSLGFQTYDSGLLFKACLLYTSPSPRDLSTSRMPSSA
eukprot:TRINITY_DN16912_c0_g1_i1.p3 TRINITY_DN16912_c0_g1~~TRINITY_DN16912_c0_g1_i1.p3  ORF type:complete len:103 (-),score=48.79 TRINITY_DN16912_c0_g1_i1:14-298(-)